MKSNKPTKQCSNNKCPVCNPDFYRDVSNITDILNEEIRKYYKNSYPIKTKVVLEVAARLVEYVLIDVVRNRRDGRKQWEPLYTDHKKRVEEIKRNVISAIPHTFLGY